MRYELCSEIPEMPGALAAAVSELDDELAEVAISNWASTGEEGRKHYRAYISVARTRRAGRKRCQIAAQQLVDPFTLRATALASA